MAQYIIFYLGIDRVGKTTMLKAWHRRQLPSFTNSKNAVVDFFNSIQIKTNEEEEALKLHQLRSKYATDRLNQFEKSVAVSCMGASTDKSSISTILPHISQTMLEEQNRTPSFGLKSWIQNKIDSLLDSFIDPIQKSRRTMLNYTYDISEPLKDNYRDLCGRFVELSKPTQSAGKDKLFIWKIENAEKNLANLYAPAPRNFSRMNKSDMCSDYISNRTRLQNCLLQNCYENIIRSEQFKSCIFKIHIFQSLLHPQVERRSNIYQMSISF